MSPEFRAWQRFVRCFSAPTRTACAQKPQFCLVFAAGSLAASSSVPQPKLALCGFACVHLKSGISSNVTMEVSATRLHYWDTQKKQYVVEPGEYESFIDAAADDMRIKLLLKVSIR